MGVEQREEALNDMMVEVRQVNEANGWHDDSRTFGEGIALLHSEVSEALEAYRDWKLEDATAAHTPSKHSPVCAWLRWVEDSLDHVKGTAPRCDCDFRLGQKPEGVGSEFADVLVRLLDECDRAGIDLAFEFERKLAHNRTRGYKHGGKGL